MSYKGDIKYLKNQINIMILQYPKIYKNLFAYFLVTKMKNFEDSE